MEQQITDIYNICSRIGGRASRSVNVALAANLACNAWEGMTLQDVLEIPGFEGLRPALAQDLHHLVTLASLADTDSTAALVMARQVTGDADLAHRLVGELRSGRG